MDINCILNCTYQINGKCALIIVPDFVMHRQTSFYEGCDCAYFQRKFY